MKKEKVWFVTGASKGLGLSLVKKLLARGELVAATSRSLSQLSRAVPAGDRFLPIAMDVSSEDSVWEAVVATHRRFGRIDVAVNNAGYGLTGALEELTDAESRANFDVNVFGTLNVIRHVLPGMRAQRSGHIINISSIGGFTGLFPGFGIYCATKFAVEGLTESLASEVKEFGIHATAVLPGLFRTHFLTADSLQSPKNEIAAYTLVRKTQSTYKVDINGNQQGDPEKAAEAMMAVADSAEPPVLLFLGADAYDLAEKKIGFIKSEMTRWQKLATATGRNTRCGKKERGGRHEGSRSGSDRRGIFPRGPLAGLPGRGIRFPVFF